MSSFKSCTCMTISTLKFTPHPFQIFLQHVPGIFYSFLFFRAIFSVYLWSKLQNFTFLSHLHCLWGKPQNFTFFRAIFTVYFRSKLQNFYFFLLFMSVMVALQYQNLSKRFTSFAPFQPTDNHHLAFDDNTVVSFEYWN